MFNKFDTIRPYTKGETCRTFPVYYPPQHQDVQPGMEYLMKPLPVFDDSNYRGSGKLKDKVAIITGGDSGIGRAVAVFFAKEGAKLVLVYYNEERDANDTKDYIERLGGTVERCVGDLKNKDFSNFIVNETLNCYGKIDILVNNAGCSVFCR